MRLLNRIFSLEIVEWEHGLFKPSKVSGQVRYATLLNPNEISFNLIQG